MSQTDKRRSNTSASFQPSAKRQNQFHLITFFIHSLLWYSWIGMDLLWGASAGRCQRGPWLLSSGPTRTAPGRKSWSASIEIDNEWRRNAGTWRWWPETGRSFPRNRDDGAPGRDDESWRVMERLWGREEREIESEKHYLRPDGTANSDDC